MALDGKRISELARVTAVGDSDLLAIDKGGAEVNSIYVGDLLGNNAAKNKVTKTGDTMTGNLTLDNSSLVLKGTNENIYYVNSNGNPGYKKSSGQTHSLTAPVGSLIMGPLTTTPAGYILCDGQAVSRTDYSELFAVLGTNFGSGDGSTTFNVPDYRGCFLRGLGGASGTLYAKQDCAVPNLSGYLAGVRRIDTIVQTDDVNNAFKWNTTTTYLEFTSVGYNSSSPRNIDPTFDASRQSSVYKNNITECRPDNFAINYYIKY